MKKIKFPAAIVWLLCIYLMNGCKSDDNSRTMIISETSYDLDEVKAVAVDCHKDSLPVEVAIKELYNYGNDILAATKADTYAFYLFNPVDFSLKERFGKTGQGPDEYINPDICLTTPPRRLYMIDGWRHRMINISDKNDTVHIGNELMNMTREIEFPYIGYYRLTDSGREFCVMDLDSGKLTDSLAISEKFPQLKKSQFVWDTSSGKAVLAFCTVDAIIVIDTDSGKLSKCLIGKGNKPAGSIMFGQIQCLKKCFIVMNLSEFESVGTQIVVFNYDCKPIILINTEIQANRMMYDIKNRRVVMLGMDDYIYSFYLPDSIKIE